MNAVSKLTGNLPRRASLAAAFAVAVVLLAAPLGAAVAVNPWQGTPSATDVAPSDAPGLNVLERAEVAATAPLTKGGAVEREVGEWIPTGDGKGGGTKGSPKK